MKDPNKNENDDFLLSFSDLRLIAKKGKNKIIALAILFGFLGGLYVLTKPLEYRVEATFREKGLSQTGLGKSLGAAIFFGGGDGNDSEAISLMKSRKLMETLVKSKDLQGIITPKEARSLFPFETIKQNLLVEYALFRKQRTPVLPDLEKDYVVRDVLFTGEIPLAYYITFKTNDEYDVLNTQKKLLAKGKIGEPVRVEGNQFTLLKLAPSNKKNYVVTLLPLASYADGLSKQFTVEPDRFDKGLLKLSYKDRDRHRAVELLNDLMYIYQDYLLTEHERISSIQMDYLQRRQIEMGQELQSMMEFHALELVSDLSNTGFADSAVAMEFLASNQQFYKKKLMAIDLEIQRLQRAQTEGGEFDYENFTSEKNTPVITNLSSSIRTFKQQADSLDLALRSNGSQSFKETFSKQLAELNDVQVCADDAEKLLVALVENRPYTPKKKLLNHPRFMVKTWYDTLESHPKGSKEAHHCKESFISYMTHLIHHLNVYQRNIEERLAYQQAPNAEFQGINLIVANDLYAGYSKQLSDVESQVVQQMHIINQMDEPEFEITSLSIVLKDPISTQMISKSSDNILILRDQENRSMKEQERLKAELAIQKDFLKIHLQQQIDLLKLNQEMIKDKIYQLQGVNLALVHEQISILQKQLAEYLASRLSNLKDEKFVLEKTISEFSSEMAKLPQKWIAERLINQQMDLNRKMVEEITKLVESKNISNNLELIQSAPVDLAIAPIHPKSPRLFMFTIAGAIAGVFIGFAWSLFSAMSTGIDASPANLRLAGQHVAGTLSKKFDPDSTGPLLDADLDTMRRIVSFINPEEILESKNNKANTVLFIQGRGPNIALPVAELMSKMGLRVLVIPLSFDQQESDEGQGLLQYLEGSAKEPKIQKGKWFDYIKAGGVSRFSQELITSRSFETLLKENSKNYDCILGISHAMPESAEVESLLHTFSFSAVNLNGETLDKLRALLHSPNKVTFIFS